ncbi:anti-sigma factor domain-containing protein [uncultured Sphingomonas sp.]|uniref:anti-sigma factor n=1 Tax=uncultured Sphingomonas sp. TaxID=158754 RepID=UPI0035CA8E7C
MSVDPATRDEDELVAAELAFGLLDPDERAVAERRLATDRDFAATHRRWQDRAVGLFVDADVTPPDAVWAAVTARLPANDVAPGTRRVRRWQFASAAAAVLAIGSTTALLLRPGSPPRVGPVARTAPRPLLAVLASPDRPAAVAIAYDPGTRRLTVLPSRLTPGTQATELWVIPAGGTPHALGVVAADGPGARAAPASAAGFIVPGATLAISLEPPGGSPTGAPTGPVILTGSLAIT